MMVFEDSRRLTGPSVWLPACGAVLELAPGLQADAALIAAWTSHVREACTALGWDVGELVALPHPGGATLAFEAPVDQLLCATEVNEWAIGAALLAASGIDAAHVAWPHAPGHPAAWDRAAAMRTLRGLSAQERQPAFVALLDAAAARGLPAVWDDDSITLGTGRGGRTWSLRTLPTPDTVPWPALHAVPAALVTGSNGKTTTVRLLAALLRAAGSTPGFSSTEGLVVGESLVEAGDYSGPAGARTVLRDTRVDAAILETARGGLLRRGLALSQADVAVITNVSPDHYGEYGVYDLARLAQVKFGVARAVRARGLLVLNADDALLRDAAQSHNGRIGWFGLDLGTTALVDARRRGDIVCGVRDGHLWLCVDGGEHDLGAVDAMPLTIAGRARYNVANLAGAAVAGHALGVDPAATAAVFARFGERNADNRGRLERWQLGGVTVWLDYAHNPDGLAQLLDVAHGGGVRGRLGLLLGQAGNRRDEDIRALAAVAGRHRPARVALKDIAGYERGRSDGAVAAVLHEALLASGVPADAIVYRGDEIDAVRDLLDWARPGDTLVLPVHGVQARHAVLALLDALAETAWIPGAPLPTITTAPA